MSLDCSIYRVLISDSSRLEDEKWAKAADLFPLTNFFDYKKACSHAIIAAKSTGSDYEVCRLNVDKMLQSSIIVYPTDNSVRQLGFIELPV